MWSPCSANVMYQCGEGHPPSGVLTIECVQMTRRPPVDVDDNTRACQSPSVIVMRFHLLKETVPRQFPGGPNSLLQLWKRWTTPGNLCGWGVWSPVIYHRESLRSFRYRSELPSIQAAVGCPARLTWSDDQLHWGEWSTFFHQSIISASIHISVWQHISTNTCMCAKMVQFSLKLCTKTRS